MLEFVSHVWWHVLLLTYVSSAHLCSDFDQVCQDRHKCRTVSSRHGRSMDQRHSGNAYSRVGGFHTAATQCCMWHDKLVSQWIWQAVRWLIPLCVVQVANHAAMNQYQPAIVFYWRFDHTLEDSWQWAHSTCTISMTEAVSVLTMPLKVQLLPFSLPFGSNTPCLWKHSCCHSHNLQMWHWAAESSLVIYRFWDCFFLLWRWSLSRHPVSDCLVDWIP